MLSKLITHHIFSEFCKVHYLKLLLCMHTHTSVCLLSYKKLCHDLSVFSFSESSLLLSAFGSIFYWHLASTTPFFLFFSLFLHLEGVQGPRHRLLHIGRCQLLQYIVISFCFNKTLSLFGFSAVCCLTLWGFFHLNIYQAYYALSPTCPLTLAILLYSNAH